MSTVKWLRVAFRKPSFSLCSREIPRSTTAELCRRSHEIMHVNGPNTMPEVQQTEKIIHLSEVQDRPESQRKRSLLTYSDSSFLIFWQIVLWKPPREGHSAWAIPPWEQIMLGMLTDWQECYDAFEWRANNPKYLLLLLLLLNLFSLSHSSWYLLHCLRQSSQTSYPPFF